MILPDRLLIFSRYPEPGKTKTRLIPLLGTVRAAKLQQRMTELVVANGLALSRLHQAHVVVCYCGGTEVQMRQWLGGQLSYQLQAQGDIGQRMYQAFRAGFADKVERIVLVGSDIPTITTELLETAFRALLEKEVVVGPALDGGYYLLGINRKSWGLIQHRLFDTIPWSTPEVFGRTLERIEACGISPEILAELEDIDQPYNMHGIEKVFGNEW